MIMERFWCSSYSTSKIRQLVIVIIFRCICESFCAAIQLNEEITIQRNTAAEDATIDMFDTLLNNYNKDLRPYFATGSAVGVTVDVYLASLDSIREDQLVFWFSQLLLQRLKFEELAGIACFFNADYEDFGITIYLRQRWHDPRLEFNSSVTLPPTTHLVDKIWIPDLVIGNAKKSTLHNLTMPNQWVQIDSRGHVLFTTRLSVQLSCAMDFHYFPFDDQRCEMELESYIQSWKKVWNIVFYGIVFVNTFISELNIVQNTIDDVHYLWNSDEPIEFNRDLLRLPQYGVKGVHVYNNCTKKLKTGEYACIAMDLLFHRLVGHYMLHSYTPSILLVTTSWVSFWLQVRGAPARVGIGVTTILSMITLYNGVRYDISRVSYIKALDVWFGVCFGFVVSALMEYALIHYLSFNKIGLPYPFLSFKSRNGQITDDPCFIMTIENNPKYDNSALKTTEGTRHRARPGGSISSVAQTNDEETTGAYANPLTCLEDETGGDDEGVNTHEDEGGTKDNDDRNTPLSKLYPIKVCVKGKCDDFAKDHDMSNSLGKRVDRICRVLFPVTFITFNIVYWVYYIKRDKIPTHVFDNQ